MATGQDILDLCEVLAPELQLQPGEADVTRALKVLNAAQDWFEILAAQEPGFLGNAHGTVSTTSGQETTTFPSGVLRIDGLQYIDPTTSRPAWDLIPIYDAGGHAPSNYWPHNLSTSATGIPRAYWTNGTDIFWDPVPDGTHTIRWMGFQTASDITAAGTFAYNDAVMLPLATFTVRVMRIGLDDPVQDYSVLAKELFEPTIATLSSFRRERGKGYKYRYRHDT